ncbi:ABC transporter permease subunit [Aggregatilinea lenta]|uniref:ABC transporter permease subunit n=1 Tax=Aggregatilinea lenta TaxID=913108 RepID=UPI001EE96DCD|nr:ABC transporter permease subunit [Aggregatilinea lenta]
MNNQTPRSSRSALRVLLIVLAVAVALVVYAYGWTTTDISLDEVQDPTRTTNVQRALRELFNPDLFDRDRESKSYFMDFFIGCPEEDQRSGRVDLEDDAYVVVSPVCADPDDVITVEGFNFPDNAIAGIRLNRATGQAQPFSIINAAGVNTQESVFDVDNTGYFKVNVKVPRARGLSGETHQVEFQTVSPSGLPHFSETARTVGDKMVETIFLALMATTLAVPISVVLSFLSARNLMREIGVPLGTVLVGFMLLPVGAVLGWVLLGRLGKLGVDWGEKPLAGILAAVIALAALVVAMRAINSIELPTGTPWPRRFRSLVMNVLLLTVGVFVLGALGGVLIWLGEQLDSGFAEYLGNFVGTLGQLIDLTIAGVGAIGGAALLGSVGSNWSADLLRHVQEPFSNILGAIFGMVSGALLMTVAAYIGGQAVLLSLLNALVAALLGGEVAVLAYQRLFQTHDGKRQAHHEDTRGDDASRTLLFVIGAVAAFLLTAWILDLLRAVVDGRPPSEREWEILGIGIRIYLGEAAIIGGILGLIAGALAGVNSTFPLGLAVYNTSRTILNALRSIEPLIMGIVFVIWVGVGPFAGVLALTLHSIASLGKLYSEQVESIESGPIEAVQATGANRLQTIVYGVVPQIIPPYIAFTMYRWDINVRMSTIIGFVGGGGIGFLLQQQINLLRYQQAGVAVLAIAIVVSVLDYSSAAIRERYV